MVAMMAKRAKADAQDVKNRYATNKRHARGGMNDSKILRGWGAIELYAGESRKTLLRKEFMGNLPAFFLTKLDISF